MATMMASPYPSRSLHHAEAEAYDHGAEEDHQEADGSYADQGELQEPTEDAWREILQAVVAMGNIMDASSELADIAAAEEAVRTKDEKRQDHVKGLWAEVDGLTDDLHKAREAAQRPANQPTSEEHRVEVDRLEQAYAQTGKQLKEEQAAVAKKEAELSRWKSEKEEVGKIEVGDEGENWADGKVGSSYTHVVDLSMGGGDEETDEGRIRLKLFTDAGFTLIPGTDNSTSKVLIRNDAKSDLHTVSLDKSRSKAYNANVIWGLASD